MQDLTKAVEEIAQQNQQLLQRLINQEEREAREGLHDENPAPSGSKNGERMGEIESCQSERQWNEEYIHQS